MLVDKGNIGPGHANLRSIWARAAIAPQFRRAPGGPHRAIGENDARHHHETADETARQRTLAKQQHRKEHCEHRHEVGGTAWHSCGSQRCDPGCTQKNATAVPNTPRQAMASQVKASGMASGPPRSSWAAGPASISVPWRGPGRGRDCAHAPQRISARSPCRRPRTPRR